MRTSIEVAQTLIQAVITGDLALAETLYAEDARLWQNLSGKEVDRARALKTIQWLAHTIEGLAYEDVRIAPTPDGFVQQHVMVGKGPGGDVRIPAVMVATVVEGKLTRVDEYMDSAHLGPLSPKRG